MRPRIRVGPVAVMILILTLLPPVHSPAEIAHAQAGPDHLDETGTIGGIFLRPGVRDEFKSSVDMAWSHTLDTLRGTEGGEAQRDQIISRYQDYTILASMSDSIGDFQFDIWVVQPISDIRIYVPSNFTFAYVSSGYGDATTQDKVFSVWTDITNDYSYISVLPLTDEDPIAPGWHVIEVGRVPTPLSPIPSFVIAPGLHHIRLFQMRAPFTAGLYHFKVYVDGRTIGDGNFPIIIVKSSLQPAYVTGLVALKELAPATNASGRVVAVGTDVAGKFREALGYFGPHDFEKIQGDDSYFRYWLFGLPAGTFELTASASGFLKTSWQITVDPGQSLSHDFELERGPEVSVKIWSRNGAGAVIPWGNLWQPPYGTNDPSLPIDDGRCHRDILLRLLDRSEQSIGYWGSDDIDLPYGSPWSGAVDGKRYYSLFVLQPSTLPSSSSYTTSLTDARGLPSVTLDGHVPADVADLIEGIDPGVYRLEIQVTGYVMREANDWQRLLTITTQTKTYAMQADLTRTSWIMATGEISNSSHTPVSNSTIAVVAKSTDNVEKGVAAGTFPAGADRFTIVLEGFNGIYNLLRPSTDYQDYGLPPVDYTLEVYMADFGMAYTGNPGVGWYHVDEPELAVYTSFGTGATSLSFHLTPSSIELILRSIRLGQPTEPSPWTFPGTGIRVMLIDESGGMAGMLDPTSYGLIQDDGTITGDPYDIDTGPMGWHAMLRVRFTGVDPGPVAALSGNYPTRIDEGKYFVDVATFGYIQRQDQSFYIQAGQRKDLQVDLVQGAQIRVEANFKHEGVSTVFNGFVRVEIYNQEDTLVGASIYAGADPNPNLAYLPYDPSKDWKLVQGAAEGAGTGPQPQRAFISQLHYGIPPTTWANWPAMIPSDANRLSVPSDQNVAFDVFGFNSYYGGPDSRNAGLWANGWDTTNGATHLDSGIGGSRDNLDMQGWGNFTIHVWAFDPYGPDGTFDSGGPDGIFGTEDDYTMPDSVDHGLSDFRAYAQVADMQGIEAPWGGALVVQVTLEEQASILGLVSWIDMHGDLRPLAWAQVIENSTGNIWTSTTDGRYRLWLDPGSHESYVTTIEDEQLWEPFHFDIVLDRTGVYTTRDIVLTSSGTATPEFQSPAWTALPPLCALLIFLSNRKLKGRRSNRPRI